MEMIRVCSVCGKEFDTAPYYIREGRDWHPVCSPFCLKQAGKENK